MKFYQRYLALLLVVFTLLGIYFYFQNKQEYANRIHTVLINLLNKKIEQEKAEAFNFAFALSQNETLQSTIENHDSVKGYKILKEHMNALESFSGTKVHAQILTNDYTIFARSWDNRDAGLNVKKYRPDLEKMKQSHRPHLSFEAARKLVLIASIPIIKSGNIIGYIEVIRRFEAIERYFANYDMSIIALLNNKYKNQAVLLNKNPRIDNMIVANDGANIEYIAYLKQVGITQLLNQGKLEGKNHFYFSRVILNNDSENIGYFILIISKKKLKLFSSFESELESFFTYARKDLYYSIIKESDTNEPFSCLETESSFKDDSKISRGKIK